MLAPKSRVDFYLANFRMGFNLVSYYSYSCFFCNQLASDFKDMNMCRGKKKEKKKNTTENADVMLLPLCEECHSQKRESRGGGNFPITKLKSPCKFSYF